MHGILETTKNGGVATTETPSRPACHVKKCPVTEKMLLDKIGPSHKTYPSDRKRRRRATIAIHKMTVLAGKQLQRVPAIKCPSLSIGLK